MREELKIESHLVEVFSSDGGFANRAKLMKDHPVLAKCFVHIGDKLLVDFLILIVKSIAALVAAEFFIRSASERFIAKETLSFHSY